MVLSIPGFIDLQVNGYIGVDFSSFDLTEDQVVETIIKLAESGTWIFLPTIVTSPIDLYEKNLKLLSSLIEKHVEIRKHMPGIHLEGPFISSQDGARGIHPREYIRKPSISIFEKMLKWARGKIKILTVSSEFENSYELIRFATKKGVIVSLGHQMANDKEIDLAIKAGAKLITHLGNGIPHTINRHNNPIFALLARDELYAMIITDGHHLPPSLIKIILKVKGPDKIMVTSDSSPLAGLNPGKYNYRGTQVILQKDQKIASVKEGYLAGSGSNMMECMNTLASFGLHNLNELLKIGFYNQAKLLGLELSAFPEKRLLFDERRYSFYYR